MSSVITTTTTTTAIEKQQERLSTFAAAWQAVDQAIHHRLSPPKLLHAPEAGGPTVLAMCLAPIPIATDKLCDEPSAEQIASGKKRCARLSFVVLKVMSPGWSFVDGEPVSTRGPAAKKGDKARFEKDKLSHLATANGVNHALMHCFEVGAKVGAIYHRGARTRECFLVSPGMVFTLKVWDDKIPKVFSGHGHANVFPFDIAFLELTAKSTNCKVQDNQLDVRRFSAVHGVSPASRVLFPSNLATTSMLHHAIVQAHHSSGTHFGMTQAALDGLRHSSNPAEAKVVVDTNHNNNNHEEDGPLPLPPSKEETLAVAIVPVLPENLTQDWIKSSLSPTISLIRVVPQTGTFAVGPDSVLRFHSEGGLLDLPCGTLLVQYDARQYPTTTTTTAATVAVAEIKNDDQVIDGDKKTAATTMMLIARGDAVSHDPWLIKLFNVAVVAGAVELLVTVDTYRGKDDGSGGGEVSLPAFARIDVSVLVAILLRATQHSLAVPLPEAVTTTFDVQGMRNAIPHLVAFPLPPSAGHYMVVDLRKLVRRPSVTTAAATSNNDAPPPLLSAVVPHTAAWERGHNVHMFIEGRLVFHFIAPVHIQGVETLSARVFEAVVIPKMQDIGADYEEDEDNNNNNQQMQLQSDDTTTTTTSSGGGALMPPPQAAAAAAPHSKKQAAASSTTAASKRKRAASDEERPAVDTTTAAV